MKIREMRHKPIKEIIGKLNQILTGHYQYYGITDNIKSLTKMQHMGKKSLYEWLNRRSQRKSCIWEGFQEMLKVYPLSESRIRVSVYAR